MKAKVYAVAIGHTVGLFDSWAGPGGAQQATSGFPGAKFKAFKTPADANSYLQEFGVAPRAPGAGVAVSSPSVRNSSASKYFQPFSRPTADPAPPASSPAGHSGAPAASDIPSNSVDELDGLDDSFLEDVDIDAIVRRHSASDAPKRPLSPSATDGPSDKHQRRSAPAVAHQQTARSATAAARPQTRSYAFHQPDAEVDRRLSAIPESIRNGLMPHQYGSRCLCLCV